MSIRADSPVWPWLSPVLPGWAWIYDELDRRLRSLVLAEISDVSPLHANAAMIVLRALRCVDIFRDVFLLQQQELVVALRHEGMTWSDVASAMNTDSGTFGEILRQSAHQKFRTPPKRVRPEAVAIHNAKFQLWREIAELYDYNLGEVLHFEIVFHFNIEYLVHEARARSSTWCQIGDALRCSRQVVHRRHKCCENQNLDEFLREDRDRVSMYAEKLLQRANVSTAERNKARQVLQLFGRPSGR